MPAELSVIIPAHNVEKTLGIVTNQTLAELKKTGKNYELIIAEDGSSDNTYGLAKKISRIHKNVKILHSNNRLGKGGALKHAFQKATGDKRIFIDADYVGVPKKLPEMLSMLEKYDIVIGSRYSKQANTQRLFSRLIASKVYIFLVKLFFFLNFSDLQCGFKGMNKKVVPLLKNIKSKNYFWDTELLVKANKSKYTIHEIPISWTEKKSAASTSLSKDSFKFMKSLIKLRLGLL